MGIRVIVDDSKKTSLLGTGILMKRKRPGHRPGPIIPHIKGAKNNVFHGL